jgi:hypothetical protein
VIRDILHPTDLSMRYVVTRPNKDFCLSYEFFTVCPAKLSSPSLSVHDGGPMNQGTSCCERFKLIDAGDIGEVSSRSFQQISQPAS